MTTLLELISTHPTVTATSMGDFAQRVGVSRATLYRWDSRMPPPEVMRRVADALDVPYGQVLAAGLRSTGHIDTVDDLLVGLQVHVVNCVDRDSERSRTVAAYATEAEMKLLVDNDSTYRFEMEGQTVTIAARAPRLPNQYFAQLNREGTTAGPSGKVCVDSHSALTGPTLFDELSDDELAATGAMRPPFIVVSNGYVMRIETRGFDEVLAQKMIARAASLLHDRIAPPNVDFGTVENLPAYDADLPPGVRERGPFHSSRTLEIAVQDLLSPEEIAQAAAAYRAAREVYKVAVREIAVFDEILEASLDDDEERTWTFKTTVLPVAAVDEGEPLWTRDHSEVGR
ncbi:helix-turn-helix transcriptional regulator [Gordonia malaquae]|uniref:helix-turn-helix domain-containing protein n=1 Tax=Gordonia malaquae TaxID=410332 RepID=UPI00301626D3